MFVCPTHVMRRREGEKERGRMKEREEGVTFLKHKRETIMLDLSKAQHHLGPHL